jgi:hypothetical protein
MAFASSNCPTLLLIRRQVGKLLFDSYEERSEELFASCRSGDYAMLCMHGISGGRRSQGALAW